MSRSRRTLLSAVILLAAVIGLGAEQGMWMPQQIPDLAARLQGARLRRATPRRSPISPASRWAPSCRSAAARRRSCRPTA